MKIEKRWEKEGGNPEMPISCFSLARGIVLKHIELLSFSAY